LQVNQLLHGNQWVNNRFLDLKQDPQFNGIQTMAGFQLGVQQLISEGISLSLSYQQMSTMQAGEVQGTHLVLRPNSFVFGIIFQPKNK
jgi:long-subunit fatty acid transport protein